MTDTAQPARAGLSPQAQEELANLAVGLAHNPKTRKEFTKLVRELDPSKRFADVEIDEVRDSVKNEFEKRDAADKADREKHRLESQRAGLISSGRFTPEEVEAMEKEVMEKHGISDYDIAAKVFSADRKPADPTPEIRSNNFALPKLSKEDFADPRAAARRKANDVVQELMTNRLKKRA